MNWMSQIWRAKYAIARAAIAGWLLVGVLSDRSAWLSRLELSAMPDMDYATEARRLSNQGDFTNALAVVDAGIAEQGTEGASLQSLRAEIVSARDDVRRKIAAFAQGAFVGRSDSLEALLGAVTADFFIVGDIRDLTIQGSRLVVDGDCDKFLLLLSAIGAGTTILPSLDGALSLLKNAGRSEARAAHSLERFAETLRASSKIDPQRAADCAAAMTRLTRALGPRGAIRAIEAGLSPEELIVLSRRVAETADAPFLLCMTRATGMRRMIEGGDAGAVTLRAAARKGAQGERWLTRSATLFRPHPLIGAAKAVWKGAPPAILREVAARLDANGWWIPAALASWLLLELTMLRGRFAGMTIRRPIPQTTAVALG